MSIRYALYIWYTIPLNRSLQSKFNVLTTAQLISFLTEKVSKIESKLSIVESTVTTLKQENEHLRLNVQTLKNENTHLRLNVQELKNENEKLKEEISQCKIRKDSNNSSMPPSSDMTKVTRNKSLRKISGKKVGGQPGHEGRTLEWTETPDEIIEHVLYTCNQCGENVVSKHKQFIESRQVIDIPPITVLCTEHQIFSERCTCGHISLGSFPAFVQSRVQYGSNIEAITAYLHTRQFMPYQRMREFYECIMNLKISKGGLNHILQRFVKKCAPMYDALKDRVEKSFSIGSDETGAAVNGKKGWYWTWQNKWFTNIVYSSNRGFSTISEIF